MNFNLGAPVCIPVWGDNREHVDKSQNQLTYISRTTRQDEYATLAAERKLPVGQIVLVVSEQKAVFLPCERYVVRI
jgi:hypothetical protein